MKAGYIGKINKKEKLQQICKELSPGDQLYVASISELGDTYEEVMETWRYLTQKSGLCVRVLDMPLLDTAEEGMGDDEDQNFNIILQLVAYFNEKLGCFTHQ